MSQANLIGRRDLLNHGAGSDFLDEFRIKPLEVQVVVGGALGVATFAWRFVGDVDWSEPEPSEAGASWTWVLPDPGYADVVQPAQAYTAGWTWTINTAGGVIPEGGALGAVTSTRYDLVEIICTGVTSDFATWVQPRCAPPILSIGEGARGWLACLAIYRLKSRQGLTPKDAGAGDDNLRMRAEDAERNIKAIGRADNRPPDLVDSSASGKGNGPRLMPTSLPRRSSRNWSL